MSKSKKWCGIWYGFDRSDRRWWAPFGFNQHNPNSEYESYEFKNKLATIKRRINNTLKKFESAFEQYGQKAIICGYLNNLQEYLIEAKDLNDELVSLIPENEHETALNWYKEQLKRVQDAKLEANVHLDERAEESSRGLSSVK